MNDTYNRSSELEKDEESYANDCALPVALQQSNIKKCHLTLNNYSIFNSRKTNIIIIIT